MAGLKNVLNALKNMATLSRPRKSGRKVSAPFAGGGTQPVFTSRSATQVQRHGGMISRIRARFQRSAKRKELKRVPVVTTSRFRGILLPVLLLAFLVALVFVASGPVVNAVSDLKFFKIREITITGCRITTPALIRELAGIRYQASLVSLNPRHVEAILRAHRWISAVEVKRDWPDVLVVSIKEYAAEALVAQEAAGSRPFYYMDKAGVTFAPVEPGQDMDFPVITGLDAQGGVGQGRPEMISEVLVLLKLVRQNNPNLPLQNLSEIHIDRDAGMTIYLVDYPFPIYFGSGQIRTKYSRLKRVLDVLYKETEQGMTIADVAYIRMDYLENKVLVAHSGSG